MYEDRTPSLLLSRLAEAAYWAGRYLERSENTARLVKTHSDLIIDLPRAATVGWAPLLAAVGEVLPDPGGPDQATEDQVMSALIADAGCDCSIRHSVRAATRNLRLTRAEMPPEASEILADLHHLTEEAVDAAVDRRTRADWLSAVVRACRTLSGMVNDSMGHDGAFCFFTIGRQIERADMIARVLDVQAVLLTERPSNGSIAPHRELCWAATLGSLGVLQHVRRLGVATSPAETLAFLLRDPRSPRTIESCLVELSRWLLELPRYEEAMTESAAIATRLQQVGTAMLTEVELRRLTGDLHRSLDRLHAKIDATWFSHDLAPVVG